MGVGGTHCSEAAMADKVLVKDTPRIEGLMPQLAIPATPPLDNRIRISTFTEDTRDLGECVGRNCLIELLSLAAFALPPFVTQTTRPPTT